MESSVSSHALSSRKNSSLIRVESDTWQVSLQHAFRSVGELLDEVSIDPHDVNSIEINNAFPILVPREFVDRIERGNPWDPLLLQVLPTHHELDSNDLFSTDPVGDLAVEVVPGLLHKYQGRVLLIATGQCAVHCRYCFRKHYPYQSSPKSRDNWSDAFRYIESDPSIDEVILSGGDPLSLGNDRLKFLIDSIAAIDHVKRLRVHTRFPVMIPHRIDQELCGIFESCGLSTWMVLHINHANEIDSNVERMVNRLKRAGITLLNQAVLLKNVNDSLDAQVTLSRRLVDIGVQPYYLHQLDRVEGAMHFEVEEEFGLSIVRQMRNVLPGYAIPQYVREVAGRPSKSHVRD